MHPLLGKGAKGASKREERDCTHKCKTHKYGHKRAM
jgi:hypothetical protein